MAYVDLEILRLRTRSYVSMLSMDYHGFTRCLQTILKFRLDKLMMKKELL